MTTEHKERVGFTCAYTPLPLIAAAGYEPYRVLPMGDAPDCAGQVLHDNLCPHVKRILDRALSGDVPELTGVVLMNSCDAMRRLADAWNKARPGDKVTLVDLPVASDSSAAERFASELTRLRETLGAWSGAAITDEKILESVHDHNRMADLMASVGEKFLRGALKGGAGRMQSFYNMAVTAPLSETMRALERAAAEPDEASSMNGAAPVLIFGNVLPDPEALALFEASGVRIVGEDFCTGSRAVQPISLDGSGDLAAQMARAILSRPRCGRTIHPDRPGSLGEEVMEAAKACNARGVIACTAKFCDPYIARLPRIREILRKAGVPMLQIEGDCAMRSFGQQRTRIEAFAEMLKG